MDAVVFLVEPHKTRSRGARQQQLNNSWPERAPLGATEQRSGGLLLLCGVWSLSCSQHRFCSGSCSVERSKCGSRYDQQQQQPRLKQEQQQQQQLQNCAALSVTTNGGGGCCCASKKIVCLTSEFNSRREKKVHENCNREVAEKSRIIRTRRPARTNPCKVCCERREQQQATRKLRTILRVQLTVVFSCGDQSDLHKISETKIEVIIIV